jgi:hypothetical protein
MHDQRSGLAIPRLLARLSPDGCGMGEMRIERMRQATVPIADLEGLCETRDSHIISQRFRRVLWCRHPELVS